MRTASEIRSGDHSSFDGDITPIAKQKVTLGFVEGGY